MNILHIVGKDLTEGNGITSAVPPLIKAQNDLKHINSKLLVISDNKIDYRHRFDIDSYICKNINKIKKYIKEIYKPDIVVFHEIYYLSFIKVYKIFSTLNIPYIIKPHCSLTKVAQQKSKIKKIVANKIMFERFILKSKGILFLNEDERKKSILNNNSIIENNGIEIIEHLPNNLKDNEKINIIYLSRIDLYHKGLDILIDAICSIDEIEFEDKNFDIKIYGTGNEVDIKFVQQKLEFIHKDYVEFKGPIYGDEKVKLMQKSNIFILTSRLEGMPMTILEAWGNGMPCIITPGTNMCDDIKENDKLGWVTEFDKEDIKKCILNAIDDYRVKSKEYNKACIDWAQKKYKWDKIVESTIQKYEYIVKQNKS